MNLKLRLTRAYIICLLCVIGFGLTAFMTLGNKLARFDNAVIARVQGLEAPLLTECMKFISFIGTGLPVVFIALISFICLYKILHHRRELILFIWVVAGSELLNRILKLLFQRARPELHRIVEANGFSFPSGHSMTAFSLYGILAFLLWRHIPTSIGRSLVIMISGLIIMATGISRVYLGVHYPSDIIGGYLASGAWLTASIYCFMSFRRERVSTSVQGKLTD